MYELNSYVEINFFKCIYFDFIELGLKLIHAKFLKNSHFFTNLPHCKLKKYRQKI